MQERKKDKKQRKKPLREEKNRGEKRNHTSKTLEPPVSVLARHDFDFSAASVQGDGGGRRLGRGGRGGGGRRRGVGVGAFGVGLLRRRRLLDVVGHHRVGLLYRHGVSRDEVVAGVPAVQEDVGGTHAGRDKREDVHWPQHRCLVLLSQRPGSKNFKLMLNITSK